MKSFLSNVDTGKVTNILNETQENVQYFQDITDKVVQSYTAPLDAVMSDIYSNIIAVEEPSLDILEKYFLELSNCIYFMGEKLEKLGIYNSLSKSAAQEVRNTAYLDAQGDRIDGKKPTVAELNAQAENAAIYETTVWNIYDRSYSIFKNKISAAETMVKTLSKIISRRMNEVQLSSMQPTTGKQILNETYIEY